VIQNLQACLEHNFPGFTILALDREDPALIESREACRAYATQRRGISPDEMQPHAQDGVESLAHMAKSVDGHMETAPA
jgi:hypothetical protein